MIIDKKILTEKLFDVIIIGGGINGAGIALDAALRDLSVLLLDKNDFGSHTTSSSTKLIHGGLRYLEYLEFSLVRESLRERERLLENAPHLLWPLKLTIPIYNTSSRGPMTIKVGMIFYDIFSFDKSLPNHHFYFGWKKSKLKNMEPSLLQDGLKSFASYYDCQVGYPERLCLEIILSANEAGAFVFNHNEVCVYESLQSDLKQVTVRDRLNGEINKFKAKVVINASGVYVDEVCRLVSDNISRKMGGTKGSHILIEKFEGGPQDALYIEAKQDGRPFFIVPWREDYYLVGTTDIYYDGDLDEITASKAEIDYLLTELNHFIPDNHFTAQDVLYSYSGIRPLLFEPGKKESRVTRKHVIYDHAKHDGFENLISIIGGKLTTYRSLAEECVDLICEKIQDKTKTKTRNYPLFGSYGISNIERYIQDVSVEYAKIYNLPLSTIEYLIRFYGSNFKNVLALADTDKSLKNPICEFNPDILAQVLYAIKYELARNLDDILVRRTGIGTSKCLGLDCVEKAAKIVAKHYDWNRKETRKQITLYKEKVNRMYLSG